jgi:hypothetical protein
MWRQMLTATLAGVQHLTYTLSTPTPTPLSKVTTSCISYAADGACEEIGGSSLGMLHACLYHCFLTTMYNKWQLHTSCAVTPYTAVPSTQQHLCRIKRGPVLSTKSDQLMY